MSSKDKLRWSLPQICYFCGEEIVKYGREPGSLCVHSLGGNHDNWDPANKVPAHKKCHLRYHRKYPSLGAEYRARPGRIVVTIPVWRKLTKMRQTPQDSYDAVLRRLLGIEESEPVE